MINEHVDNLPDMGFANGNLAGIQAFRDLMDDAKVEGQDHTLRILRILSEAVKTVHEADMGSCKKSAAVKLLELISDSLEFRARNDDYGAWLDTKQIEALRFRQTVMRVDAMRRSRKIQEDARFRSFMAGVAAL